MQAAKFIIFVSFPKMFQSIIYFVTELLSPYKWLFRSNNTDICISPLLGHIIDTTVLFATINKVICVFKSNQIGELIPETPELIWKTHL